MDAATVMDATADHALRSCRTIHLNEQPRLRSGIVMLSKAKHLGFTQAFPLPEILRGVPLRMTLAALMREKSCQ